MELRKDLVKNNRDKMSKSVKQIVNLNLFKSSTIGLKINFEPDKL